MQENECVERAETVEISVPIRPGMWVVEIQDDECVRRIPLGAERMVVGAGRGVDILIRDATVSARHCAICAGESGVVVEDLGSRNGTYVGGARIKEASGIEGTVITIGQTTMVCLVQEEDIEAPPCEPLPGVAGASTPMLRVAALVRRLAKLSAPVLIAGETGVGKELVARALHNEGTRASGPFVALNVSSLPRELVESELFGHERGAFTGAVARRVGAFTEAEGGTLFLDEIGELSLDAQPKLLRALDGYEVRRVGSAGAGRRSTARVVAATHVPLVERVERGEFRRDLFHRLEVFIVEVPPLRARPGDIVPIARALLAEAASEIGPRRLTPGAIGQLTAHDWPGNVRELRNVLYRAADCAVREGWIDGAAVHRALRKPASSCLTLTRAQATEWLVKHQGNISAAARAAGVPRTSFRKLLAPTGGESSQHPWARRRPRRTRGR